MEEASLASSFSIALPYSSTATMEADSKGTEKHVEKEEDMESHTTKGRWGYGRSDRDRAPYGGDERDVIGVDSLQSSL